MNANDEETVAWEKSETESGDAQIYREEEEEKGEQEQLLGARPIPFNA